LVNDLVKLHAKTNGAETIANGRRRINPMKNIMNKATFKIFESRWFSKNDLAIT
jgi:hypothetical protein